MDIEVKCAMYTLKQGCVTENTEFGLERLFWGYFWAEMWMKLEERLFRQRIANTKALGQKHAQNIWGTVKKGGESVRNEVREERRDHVRDIIVKMLEISSKVAGTASGTYMLRRQ